MYQSETSILFIVFNRLEVTKKVFDAISKVKPHRLYISSDGPRPEKVDENRKVGSIRKWILDNVNWSCEVKTLFRENNLGCRMAVSTAIDWFFENEEMGIILEDDCLPTDSFFPFCDELLNRYKNSNSVMCISGSCPSNRLGEEIINGESYHFSKYFHCWGWATWRRAWASYDRDLKGWKNFKDANRLAALQHSSFWFKRYWIRHFDAVQAGKIDTWDYQMLFNLLDNNGLSITPKMNMVSNIGFGSDATHTVDPNDPNSNAVSADITFPLVHPDSIAQNSKADKLVNKLSYGIGVQLEIRRIYKGLRSKLTKRFSSL